MDTQFSHEPISHRLSDRSLSEDEIQDLRSKLPDALTKGTFEDVKNLIQTQAALNIRIDYDCPAFDDYSTTNIPLLHIAAAYASPEVVSFLLDSGADVKETALTTTVLYLAAREGRTENLKILLECGAKDLLNVKLPGKGNYPLHEAAFVGHAETCQLLVQHGADLGLKNQHGYTALMLAAWFDRAETISVLLDSGAGVDEVDPRGWTPLHFAANMNRGEAIRVLLSRDADVTLQDEDIGNPLHMAANEGGANAATALLSQAPSACFNAPNDYGNTPLHLAALRGHPHIVKILADYGVDKDARNMDGNTPLHIACNKGRVEVINILVAAGANIEICNNIENTALQLAANQGDPVIVSVLLKKGANVDTNNESGNTPLQLASSKGHYEVARLLLQYNAAVNTCTEKGTTSLHLAANNGHTKVISLLLDHRADISRRDEGGYTALHLACDKGHADAAGLLIDNKADLNAQSNEKEDPLNLAARGGHLDTVKLLLARGAQINRSDIYGHTPLIQACLHKNFDVIEFLVRQNADVHKRDRRGGKSAFSIAYSADDLVPFMSILKVRPDRLRIDAKRWSALHYACRNGRRDTVQQLLRDGAIDPSLPTRKGQSALCLAIEKDQVDIVFDLLNSQQYYPSTPIGTKACSTASGEIQIIADVLIDILSELQPELSDRAGAILYWAISNNQSDLITRFLDRHQHQLPWLKGRMTCLHVAAQYGLIGLIEDRFRDHNVRGVTNDGLTPFHVAAAQGNLGVMKTLFGLISGDLNKEIEAIIELSNDQESPLSLAIKRRDPEMKVFLWDKLETLAMKNRDFRKKNPGQAQRILQLAAQLEKPGEEVHLQMMFDMWFEKSDLPSTAATVLHLAILYREVVVLWWLLSNGGHFKNQEIDLANKILETQKDDLSVIMLDLLRNPPPVVEQPSITDSDYPPIRPKMPAGLEDLNNLPVAILDFYNKQNNVELHYTTRSVEKVIYDPTHGPEEVLRSARTNGYRQLKFLEHVLQHSEHDRDTQMQNNFGSNKAPSMTPEILVDRGKLQFRWLHIPANCMQLTTDLATVLSVEKKRTEKEHRRLAKFFQRSCPKIAAGQGKSYIKPQCVGDGDPKKLELSKTHRFALYMPFLTLGEIGQETDNPLQNGSEKGEDSSAIPTIHEPMTLDQFYYPTIEDTSRRDKNQVLSRYLQRAEGLNGSNNVDNPTYGDGKTQGTSRGDPLKKRRILVVDQLWLWIIDGTTIITSCTKPSDRSEDLLSAGIRDFVMSRQNKDSFDRVTSVDSMVEAVLRVATGLFMERIIQKAKISRAGTWENKSALEVFRESIRHVSDQEATLFNTFLKSLEDEREQKPQHSHKGWIGNQPDNPYHVISQEALLLDEIKDIQDELNMLRTLTEAQAHVWKQAFETMEQDSLTKFQFTNIYTPELVLQDITEMMVEAVAVQTSINTLLDLRQKQASIKEAEFGRRQANDTGKQANIILVFALVTIIFLPLSFLSSLFALNVTDFPHASSGTVEYQGWWIFPILIGVSMGVSIPFILLAFNVDTVLRFLNRISSKIQKMKPKDPSAVNVSSPQDGVIPSHPRGKPVPTAKVENRSLASDSSMDRPNSLHMLRKFRRQRPSTGPC